VYYADAQAGLATEREVTVLADISPELSRPLWEEATQTEVRDRDLETVPEPEALFAEVPAALGDPKSYLAWTRDFREWLYRSQSLRVFRSPSLQVASNPGESERDFRLRLQQTGRERRDQLLERLRQRYTTRIVSLQERIRRAAQTVEREQEQAKQQKLQTAISVGVTLLDAFMGRKAIRRTTLGRATTAARGAGRILKEGQDVGRAEENVQALQQQLAQLEAQVARESEALKTAVDPLSEELEALEVKPKKTDISVRVLSLGWAPYWRDERGGMTPAF
jgi:Sec-independent protein translocase protein TatA